MSWHVGDRLGPYEILAPIGKGGMGEVWKARDTRLNRIVAIKRMAERHSARFEQEARAIAALNHPNICQIHDIGPDYLVLEYIDGKPLLGPLSSEEAMRLALQIASALEEAHSRGVLHRDLKPSNILVTAKGTAKLLDFGLAKLTTDSEADFTKTIEGTVAGTVAYMSPEQAQGKPLDARPTSSPSAPCSTSCSQAAAPSRRTPPSARLRLSCTRNLVRFRDGWTLYAWLPAASTSHFLDAIRARQNFTPRWQQVPQNRKANRPRSQSSPSPT